MAILRYSAFGPSSADSAGLTAAAGAAEGYLGTRYGLKRDREQQRLDEQEIEMQRQRLAQFERRLQIAEAEEAREIEFEESRRALMELASMEPGVDRTAAMEQGGMPELPEEVRRKRIKARLSPEDRLLLGNLEQQAEEKKRQQEADRQLLNRATVAAGEDERAAPMLQVIADPNSTPEARQEAFAGVMQLREDTQTQQQLGTILEEIGALMSTVSPMGEPGEENPEYGFIKGIERALIEGKINPPVAAMALRSFSPDLDAAMKQSGLPPRAAFAAKMAASQAMVSGGMRQQAAEQGGMPQPPPPLEPGMIDPYSFDDTAVSTPHDPQELVRSAKSFNHRDVDKPLVVAHLVAAMQAMVEQGVTGEALDVRMNGMALSLGVKPSKSLFNAVKKALEGDEGGFLKLGPTGKQAIAAWPGIKQAVSAFFSDEGGDLPILEALAEEWNKAGPKSKATPGRRTPTRPPAEDPERIRARQERQ